MNLGLNFELTLFSVGRFTPTLLCIIIFLYLLQRSNKELGSIWFCFYFLFLSIYNIGYVIGYSINLASGGYGWYLACAIVFAAASRLQISFSFPAAIYEKQRKYILVLSFSMGVFACLEYAWNAGNSSQLGFAVHAYGSRYVSIFIPSFSFLFYILSLIVSLSRLIGLVRRKVTDGLSKRVWQLWHENSEFRLTLAMIGVTVSEILITIFFLLNINRMLNTTALAEIMNLGALLIFICYAFIFSSSASGRIGIITRLIGITLVSFLFVLHFMTRFYQQKSLDDFYLQLRQKVKYSAQAPALKSNEISIYTIDLSYKSDRVFDQLLRQEISKAYYDGHLYFFKIGLYPIVALSLEEASVRKLGFFGYDKYRQEVHQILYPSILFYLAVSFLILFIFPLLFRANFSIPLNNLMKDLALLSHGTKNKDSFQEAANEIVSLRSAFDQMAQLLKTAKGDMPEVSTQIELLNQILHTEAQKIQVGKQTLVYRSPAVRKTLDEVFRASRYRYPILITGETGTGKELIAKLIHESSDEAQGPFIAINCATLPENLWESEIFGHKKGSFTDAKSDRKGRILEASGGSVFFDEIGEMPLSIQPKMLRLLQENTFVPLGSDSTINAECRFIFATNRDLEKMVKQSQFREDLLYRIRVFPVQLPSLRERVEDIPHLLRYFVDRFANEYKINSPEIENTLLQKLMAYAWPGNIREMENTVIRAMAGNTGSVLRLEHFQNLTLTTGATSRQALHQATQTSYEEEMRNFSRHLIESVYLENKGNVTKTAEALSMKRTTLRYQLIELGILDPKNGK